ncbi:SemiSWEET family sugar transporter [Litorimonas haliclonae]|uniref:SemiSWEET family sugar transporter n=1 Tax=Litorimonas haliclonae TaxID=2081977 RepID=UPI0039F0BBFF
MSSSALSLTEIVGFCAAIMTTLSFVPQIVLIIRTRRTSGISLLMYSIYVVGIVMWFAYGVMTGSLPLILSQTVTLVITGSILFIAARERLSRMGTLQSRAPGEVLEPFQNPDIIYHQDNNAGTIKSGIS